MRWFINSSKNQKTMKTFKELNLSAQLVQTLEKIGYITPTQIQEQAIPLILSQEYDLVAQAATGTGKTASFALPIIDLITKKGHVQAIILTPTRELAVQVTQEIKNFSENKNLTTLAVYGGASIQDQIKTLKKGVDIVVGTPGRVIDLLQRRDLKLNNISYAVLDEADEMLNMGFLESIEDILKKTNPTKKIYLFSATMPKPILQIAKRFMNKYQLIKVEKKQDTSNLIEHIAYELQSNNRYAALRRIIAANPNFYGIVFCKTKVEVDALNHKLAGEFPADALHGDISQSQREAILNKFRKKTIKLLVATDVAARGIDVNNITHVINYSLPQSPETYVHRTGRTGRAGNKGEAITFVMPVEKRKLKAVEKELGKKLIIKELPQLDDIMKQKKAHITTIIKDIVHADKTREYDSIVQELLHEATPEKIVAAVLKYAFHDELDKNKYTTNKDVTPQPKPSRQRNDSRKRTDSRQRPREGARSNDKRGPRNRQKSKAKSPPSNPTGPKRFAKKNKRR